MLTIKEMLYKFDVQADQVSSKNRINLPVPAKIAILNEAQLAVVKQKANSENPNRAAFQQTRKRTEELQILETVEKELKATPFKKESEIFQADLTKLDPRHYIITRQYAMASSAKCEGESFRVRLHDSQSDDMETLQFSTNTRPSLKWRRGLSKTASDKIFVYASDFIVTQVIVDYLRYPIKMEVEGFKTFAGISSKDVHCELPLSVQEDIVREAVVNINLYMQSPGIQAAIAAKDRSE